MSQRLLIVEDDLALRTGLTDSFTGEGFDVTVAEDGDRGHEILFTRHFDVVVLDLMLPGRSGLELLREMREQGMTTPVLLLTARGQESDKVLGLELGADDYVTKPFGIRELVARVRALVRRATSGNEKRTVEKFQVGEDVTVDLEAYEVRRGEQVHKLSKKEAAMLGLLHQNLEKAVSRERFLNEVWGTDQFVGTRTVDTHMLNLRQKLELDHRNPRFLLTVHGVGYRLVLEP
ncbi:MAG: response regulator transcription factor [Planctomycetota bacterium]|jgi:DNA-binding response OmpR family regulator